MTDNTIENIFQTIEANITPEKAEKLKGTTFLFDVADQKYLADFEQDAAPYIRKVIEGEAKCNITVGNPDDWSDIVSGKLNPTSAFMTGKIKIKGDMGLAMKLSALV